MENEQRLLSLINSVKVLNTTHDLDDVLHQLIKEALNVIDGANASVLFLYDEHTDKLYVKSAIGFDMEYLHDVRLNPGEGMSGRTFVSKQGSIFSSETETTEGMSNLTSETEKMYARSLGLMQYPMSAICVPLITNEYCIGVLTVDIYREKAQFDARDLQLLETFAAQAVIAIENATLFTQNERTKRIHEQLSKVSLSKGGLQDITRTLASLVKNKVVVFNEFADLLAYSDESAERLSGEIVNKHMDIILAAINGETISYHELTIMDHELFIYLFPIKNDKLPIGLLAVISEKDIGLDPLDRFAMEQALTIFALEMNRRERVLLENVHSSSYILEQLIHAPYDGLSFKHLTDINFPEHDNHRYVVARLYIQDPLVSFQEISDKKQQLFRMIYREISQLPYKTLLYERNMTITCLFIVSASLDEAKIFANLSELFRKIMYKSEARLQLSHIVGLGQVVEKLKDVRQSYRDAKRCVQYLQSTKQSGQILTYQELGPYRLFVKTDQRELKEYIQLVVGSIVTYDKANGTELLDTLRVYLNANQNMAESAKALYVHVNTIKYRLKTINEILNIDKLTGQKAFELQLGLNIIDFLGDRK